MKQSILRLYFAGLFSALAMSANATDWNGAYAGFTVGENQTKHDWSAEGHFAPTFPITPIPFTSKPQSSFENRDVVFGFYAGYNWLLDNNLVSGLEVTLRSTAGSARQTTIPGSNIGGSFPFPASSLTAETEFDSSIRGRIGTLLTPSTLVYGAAGIAFAQLELTGECPRDTNVCNPGTAPKKSTDTSIEAGWNLGLGVESAIDENILLRLEYNYTDYGYTKFNAVNIIPGQAFGIRGKLENTAQSITAGVTFKF